MPRQSHFGQFQDHTRLKHFLLDAYLKQWATILITGFRQRGHRPPPLWFIDAFAGAGRDETGTAGSPVIAAEIARAVNAEHFADGTSKDGMRVIAIEADEGRYERLCTNLEPYTKAPRVAYARHGTLQKILDRLLEHVGGGAVFFFLDPFGVDGLDAAILPRILARKQREVLLLFSDEGAVRLAGKAGAQVPTREELLAQRKRDPSMFGEDFDAQLAEADRLAVERVLAGHQSNDRAREILDRAFGGHWWRPLIEATPVPERQEKFVELYEQVLRESGATHVLRFAVTTETGRRRHKYTLLHASKHKRAYTAMKDAMDRARRRHEPPAESTLFDESGSSATMASPGVSFVAEIGKLADVIANEFAGKIVPWTSKKRSDVSVSQFALDETPLFPRELPALAAELERRGYTAKKPDGKPEMPKAFSFPPAA